MKPNVLLYTGIALLVNLNVVMSDSIFDDFDDGNDTDPAWIFVDAVSGGSRDFGPSNNQYRMNGLAVVSVRPDLTFSDGDVRVELTGWNAGIAAGSSMGIVFRFNPNDLSGYFLSIDADGSPAMALIKIAPGGAPSSLFTGSTRAYDPAKTYILQATVAGPQFICQVFEKGESGNVVVDQFSVSDNTSPYTAGLTGCLVANDSFTTDPTLATGVFDNFFVSTGPAPRPQIASLGRNNGQIQFGFGRQPGWTYVVEYKNDLTAPLWSELTRRAPSPRADTVVVAEDITPVIRYYQVRVASGDPAAP